jgi:hypothetical protein
MVKLARHLAETIWVKTGSLYQRKSWIFRYPSALG